MRITLVGPTYPFRGGISHYTTLLCQQLRQSHTVRFLTYHRQYPAWLFPGRSDRDPSTASPLRVQAEPLIDSLNPASWWQAGQVIKQEQPELLLLQWSVPFWAPLLLTLVTLTRRWSPATRIFLLCHNAIPHERGGMIGRRVTSQVQRKLFGQVDGILCHSRPDLEEIRQLVPEQRVERVMHPTYAPLAGSQSAMTREVARQQLGLSDEPVLLFFGFVRPYKGIDLLFQALPPVLERFPGTTLVVAGEWWADAMPAREWLEHLSIEDRVRLLDDYLPDEALPPLFAAADVVVLPYRSATQSGVIQLAFGFNVPVITTATGGLPEAVEHERNGFVVPPENPAALAEAIIRYQEEGWRERLAPGVAAARERFSWAALVEGIERLAHHG